MSAFQSFSVLAFPRFSVSKRSLDTTPFFLLMRTSAFSFQRFSFSKRSLDLTPFPYLSDFHFNFSTSHQLNGLTAQRGPARSDPARCFPLLAWGTRRS